MSNKALLKMTCVRLEDNLVAMESSKVEEKESLLSCAYEQCGKEIENRQLAYKASDTMYFCSQGCSMFYSIFGKKQVGSVCVTIEYVKRN